MGPLKKHVRAQGKEHPSLRKMRGWSLRVVQEWHGKQGSLKKQPASKSCCMCWDPRLGGTNPRRIYNSGHLIFMMSASQRRQGRPREAEHPTQGHTASKHQVLLTCPPSPCRSMSPSGPFSYSPERATRSFQGPWLSRGLEACPS